MKRYLFKGNIQTSNKNTNRCLTTFIIREMQIKTTMSHHLIYIRMAVIKKTQ